MPLMCKSERDTEPRRWKPEIETETKTVKIRNWRQGFDKSNL